MKNLVSYCTLILLVGFQSCELFNTPKPKTELEKLPPATQEGKETWGCLINSKAWYETIAAGHYQNGSLAVYANQKILEPVLQGMGFDLSESIADPALTIGTYSLLPTAQYDPWARVNRKSCWYGGSSFRNDVIGGELVITRFDKSLFIISGTFQFTIVHDGCDTLRVTDGRFDMHYAP